MAAVRKPAEPFPATAMTVAEFLDWPGDGTGTRYQLVHGEPRAMAPVPALAADANLRVPDLAVTCAPDEPDGKLFPAPVLIVEILSPVNVRNTRDNLWVYSSIPSVADILFLRSTGIGAELHRRRVDGHWPERPIRIAGGEVRCWRASASACRWGRSTPAPIWPAGRSRPTVGGAVGVAGGVLL